jgi:hypothetical protein
MLMAIAGGWYAADNWVHEPFDYIVSAQNRSGGHCAVVRVHPGVCDGVRAVAPAAATWERTTGAARRDGNVEEHGVSGGCANRARCLLSWASAIAI